MKYLIPYSFSGNIPGLHHTANIFVITIPSSLAFVKYSNHSAFSNGEVPVHIKW